ncbi:histidinol-phosphate transaminase [Sodalis-like symbiont of Philaenus spumarius]|nr:histidinol-phosphate transaminase [Sodalis-like symbiont of Philaenus spumarius]
MSLNHLARANVLVLEPSLSGRRLGGQGDIWLNDNDYSLPPEYGLSCGDLNRYPACQPAGVINGYTAAGVQSEQVVVCNGADAILFCPPTDGMYTVSVETSGITRRTVEARQDRQMDLQASRVRLDSVKMVYICSPNNPTGNLINPETLRALLVVDAAYIDFYPSASVVNWLAEYPHLVILRTLSKVFALASLRCGFILANVKVIQLLLKVIALYPLALPVADITEQALSDEGLRQMRTRVAEINANRETRAHELADCPGICVVYPSVSNYLLVRCDPAYRVFKTLWDQGTILRDQSKQPGLDDCLRITIDTLAECQSVIAA